MVAPAGEDTQGGREVGHRGSHPGHGDCGYLPLTRTTRDQLSTGFPGRSAPLWQSFRNWTGIVPAWDQMSIAVAGGARTPIAMGQMV